MTNLDRREFLKLASLFPLAYVAARTGGHLLQAGEPGAPNVLIVVFDALTSYNIGMFGYSRETMPNLSRLAERAVVYHQHYAGGSFTSPGTASLLTGTLPWTHRVMKFNGRVVQSRVRHNIFDVFEGHNRIAYSHNPLPNTLFYQFEQAIDTLKERAELFVFNDHIADTIFKKDYVTANDAKRQTLLLNNESNVASSLFLSHAYTKYENDRKEALLKAYEELFPRGLPSIGEEKYFILEDGIDWAAQQARTAGEPFLGYMHFWPPHDPYRTRHEFIDFFRTDTYSPVDKPQHILNEGAPIRAEKLQRRLYDENILYVDAEFQRLYATLEANGVLENTIVVFTADHGEMFERGITGHFHRTLHQPVTHIPLLIFLPGNEQRVDVHVPTSAVDVLPTLAHLAGYTPPEWSEGTVMPPFSSALVDGKRPVYTVEAKHNPPFGVFEEATFSMIEWPYKLHYYMGYEELPGVEKRYFELYNIEDDPEELVDLSGAETALLSKMVADLEAKLDEVNAPYRN